MVFTRFPLLYSQRSVPGAGGALSLKELFERVQTQKRVYGDLRRKTFFLFQKLMYFFRGAYSLIGKAYRS